jgi:NitT/TauT family transport system permease protein
MPKPSRAEGPEVPGAPARPPARVRLWAVLAWLAVWELAARLVSQPIVLAAPSAVLVRLAQLSAAPAFWAAVGLTLGRVAAGFLLGALAGGALAAAAGRWRRVEELLAPLMAAVKAVPVASFVVLALFWFSSRGLSTCVAFLVALPVVYVNVLQGLRSCDRSLREMARVFGLGRARYARHVALPQLAPYVEAACSLAVGTCWKAGVAAELIGVPAGTVGERLYQAKIYLETPDVLAWTLAVVLASVACEKLLLAALRAVRARLVRVRAGAGRGARVPGAAPAKKPGLSGGEAPAAPAVAVRDLAFRYPGAEAPVLAGAACTLEAGRTYALQGPSGAGKTTFARLLLGLERPAAGTLHGLEGVPCAAAFQEPRLVGGLTALQNVLLAHPAATRDQVMEAFRRLGVEGCAHRAARDLSGGQARRVALARALVGDAPFVVLDEAFASLDAGSRAQALAWARGRLAGRTALVVTHDPAEAAALGAVPLRGVLH